MVIGLLAALARGQEPAPPPPPDERQPSTEIIVIGEREVEAARQAVIRRVEELGYTRIRDRGEKVVLKDPDEHWRGKVFVYDDGRIAAKRTGPTGKKMAPIKGTNFRPYPLCIIMPTACVAFGSAFLADRKWAGIEGEVVDATAGGVHKWNEKIADRESVGRVDAVPELLTATWERGEPLVGTERLDTPAARRAEILAYWETRTETRWGLDVREAIERFVRSEVMTSDTPYAPAEIEAFVTHSQAAKPFPFTLAPPPAEPAPDAPPP